MKKFALFFAISLFIATQPAKALETQPLDPSSQKIFDQLGTDLMCLCGCNTTLKHCPHTNCSYAVPARKRIRKLLGEGKSYDEIVAVFVKARGEVALAAPKKEGFNLVGYVMPFLALIVAGSGVAVTAKKWAGRKEITPFVPEGDYDTSNTVEAHKSELEAKLKKELEDFDS